MEHLLAQESTLRLSIFIGLIITFVVWERLKPRRTLTQNKKTRWISNFSIVGLNTIFLRIFLPITAIEFALWTQDKDFGVLNLIGVAPTVSTLLAILFLDLAIYFQHILFHKVPIFWRLHRMHHTDLDLDVSSGGRFHPLEILLSMGFKFLVIFLIGAPPEAVLIFEILLNATSLFNHSNIYLSPKVDSLIRFFLVTPDMHRIHHSILVKETNSNYGFCLPLWDRIFRTYTKEPQSDPQKMLLGLEDFRESRFARLGAMLIQPFIVYKK